MGQVITFNMWVYTVLSLPEPGTRLQLAGTGAREWQSPASKDYATIWRGGTKNGYAGSLESWIGSVDGGFGEDGKFWAGIEMGQLDW